MTLTPTVSKITTPADAEHVTLNEAAELLGVHPNTVRNRIKRGLLPADKVMTLNGEAYAIPKTALTLTSPSQQFERVTTGSNRVVPSPDAPSDRGNEALVMPTRGLQVTLLTALQQAVAPLADANARQAEELGRLREIARQQAEELGRLRERLAAIEAARSASADTSNGMHASTNVGPDVRQEHEGRRGTTQDERAALWRALATRALAVPAAMPPAPQAGLPRPRSRSLLGRVAAWIAEQSG